MDQLVDLTNGTSVASLRELSTTSAILLQRFGRLIQYGRSVPQAFTPDGVPVLPTRGATEAPPLLQFVAALQLFVDAFAATGSNRLVHVARPPILAYGLYGNSDIAPAQRLVALTMARGTLVEAVDCFAGCGCEGRRVPALVVFDAVLSQIDRAIDLWSVGTDADGRGEPERRAVTAGLFARQALDFGLHGPSGSDGVLQQDDDAATALATVDQALTNGFDPGDPDTGRLVARELRHAFAGERQVERLVRNLAAGCAHGEVFAPGFDFAPNNSLVRALLRQIFKAVTGSWDIELSETIELPPSLAQSWAAGSFGHPNYIQDVEH